MRDRTVSAMTAGQMMQRRVQPFHGDHRDQRGHGHQPGKCHSRTVHAATAVRKMQKSCAVPAAVEQSRFHQRGNLSPDFPSSRSYRPRRSKTIGQFLETSNSPCALRFPVSLSLPQRTHLPRCREACRSSRSYACPPAGFRKIANEASPIFCRQNCPSTHSVVSPYFTQRLKLMLEASSKYRTGTGISPRRKPK